MSGDWPLKHVGLPLGGNPKAVEFWAPVLEKVEKRLDGWRKARLSRCGRLTLIQSVLSCLPTCFMSLFFAFSISVAKRIEKAMRDFCEKELGREEGIIW